MVAVDASATRPELWQRAVHDQKVLGGRAPRAKVKLSVGSGSPRAEVRLEEPRYPAAPEMHVHISGNTPPSPRILGE